MDDHKVDALVEKKTERIRLVSDSTVVLATQDSVRIVAADSDGETAPPNSSVSISGISIAGNPITGNSIVGNSVAGRAIDDSAAAPGGNSSESARLSSIPKNRPIGKIGDYDLLEEVGASPVARFYRAYSKTVQKDVAIKVISPELCQEASLLKRFKQEAKAASELNHPNLCSVYDYGVTESGCAYMVTDFLPGISLKQLLEREAYLDPDRALEIFRQTCHGLNHLHSHDLVHRNLNPSNIFLVDTDSPHDFVKVVDFGIGRILDAPRQDDEQRDIESPADPRYMSPEQVMGYKLDARSDVYALGLIMYETLSGKQPFAMHNRVQTIMKQLNGKPRSFRSLSHDLDVPEELERIVFKCLEKNRSARYGSADDVCMDLDLFASPVSDKSKPAPAKKEASSKKRKRRRRIIYASLAILALFFGSYVAIKQMIKANRSYNRTAMRSVFLPGVNQFPRMNAAVTWQEAKLAANNLYDKQAYEEAIPQFERAIAFYRAENALDQVGAGTQVLPQLAELYLRLGTAYLNKPVDIALQNTGAAINTATYPFSDPSLAQYREAEQAFESAINYFGGIKAVSGNADLLWNMADVKYKRHKYDEALAFHKALIPLLEKSKDSDWLIANYYQMGVNATVQSSYKEAENYYRKAWEYDKATYTNPSSGNHSIQIPTSLASTLLSEGRVKDAERLAKANVMTILAQSKDNFISSLDKTELERNYSYLYDIYTLQGKKKEAEKMHLKLLRSQKTY